MKKKITMIVCAMMFCIAGLAQQAKPTLTSVEGNPGEFKFEHDVFEFGKITQGDSVYHEFTFTNIGSEPIIIQDAQVTCGCTHPIFPLSPVKQGEKGIIKVTFRSAGKMGVQDKTITLISNAKQKPMVLHLKGTVELPQVKESIQN
jgi:hypothetical protein